MFFSAFLKILDALREIFQLFLGELRQMLQLVHKFPNTFVGAESCQIGKKAGDHRGDDGNNGDGIHRQHHGDDPADERHRHNIAVADGGGGGKAKPKAVDVVVNMRLDQPNRYRAYKKHDQIAADDLVCAGSLKRFS